MFLQGNLGAGLSIFLLGLVSHLPIVFSLLPELGGAWGESMELSGESTSILAWRIPWIEEPGGLQSMGLQRVGHN